MEEKLHLDRIIRRIETRAKESVGEEHPSVTLISYPVDSVERLIYRTKHPIWKIIKPPEIYEFMKTHAIIPFNPDEREFGTRKVIGGVCFVGNGFYYEINEHGIVYRSERLHDNHDNDQTFEDYSVIHKIFEHIYIASTFYEKCQYFDEVEIATKLEHVKGWSVETNLNPHVESIPSIESSVSAITSCHSPSQLSVEECVGIILDLADQILWIFNLYDDSWRNLWNRRLVDWFHSFNMPASRNE